MPLKIWLSKDKTWLDIYSLRKLLLFGLIYIVELFLDRLLVWLHAKQSRMRRHVKNAKSCGHGRNDEYPQEEPNEDASDYTFTSFVIHYYPISKSTCRSLELLAATLTWWRPYDLDRPIGLHCAQCVGRLCWAPARIVAQNCRRAQCWTERCLSIRHWRQNLIPGNKTKRRQQKQQPVFIRLRL